MTAISRIPVPGLPNGRVQRKIPKPFARPSITIGGCEPTERREWANVPAHQLRAGDIVPGIGRLFEVTEGVTSPAYNSGLPWREVADLVSWTVTVKGGVANTRTYQGGEAVWAFTAASATVDG